MRLHATLLGGLLAASQVSAALLAPPFGYPPTPTPSPPCGRESSSKSQATSTPGVGSLTGTGGGTRTRSRPFPRDLNASGIRLQTPWHFFVRGGLAKDDPITLGASLS